MGLIDKLRRVGGIVKNRLASSVGALRAQLGRVSVRVPARLGRLAIRAPRAVGLATPLGAGLTAATFAPELFRAGRAIGRVLRRAVPRGIAFFAGRRIVTAAAGGGVAGAAAGVLSRRSGKVVRPSDVAILPTARPRERPGAPTRPRRRAPTRPRRRKRRIPAHGHRVISVRAPSRRKRKRATHRSPRHPGHKRVSFTTADGKKVSFLANPKARHR